MKAKQAKRNKKWAAKHDKKDSVKPNKPLADPETFEEDEEDEYQQTFAIGDKTNSTNGNDNFVEEEDDENDANGWKKKKKSGGFQSMGLSQPVIKGILKRGYKVPTPIQRKAIPLILEGKDVVAMARTGSGKTAAFLIPLFEKLQLSKTRIGVGQTVKYPRAIILSPTRELATQTLKFFKEIGKHVDLKAIAILGGDSMENQFAALNDKPDVIVATPGRFMHLCVEMEFKLDGVEYMVFDEADRLFEMGFGEQITEILKRLPSDRQTVLFSATLPRILVEFTKAGLHDPTLIRLDVDTKLPERLTLTHLGCRSEDKLSVLLHLLKYEIYSRDQTIVFVATKHHVEFLHSVLDEANISNCYIYSSLDAAARKISLGKFRTGKSNVMIVTDIAARGIDIPILDYVINYHFPPKPKLFMHRVGRVARAGRSGTAISLVSPDEISSLIDLHLFLGRPLKFTSNDATTSVKNDNNDDNSVLVGRVPQDVIDEEVSFITNLMAIKLDLESLSRVARNGYQQYLKSRPNASVESNKRAKGVEISTLPLHPLFGSKFKEDPMNNFISQLHSYRPNSTIFEVGPKAGSETHKMMQLKRTRDQNVVEKYRVEKSNTVDANIDPTAPVQSTKDEEVFINYLPKDHHTETGLSVGTIFDKQIQESVMDLTGDDSSALRSQHNLQRWDRKRKKFVSVGKDNPNHKKIKTESGTWIPASYKSDRYKSWQEKSKIAQQQQAEDSDDGDGEASGGQFNGMDPLKRRPAFSKKLVKTGKNEAPRFDFKNTAQKGDRRFKSEIKRPEQILKNRKVQEAKQRKSGGGPKGKGKKASRGRGDKSGGSFGGGSKGGFGSKGKPGFGGGGKSKGGFSKKRK